MTDPKVGRPMCALIVVRASGYCSGILPTAGLTVLMRDRVIFDENV